VEGIGRKETKVLRVTESELLGTNAAVGSKVELRSKDKTPLKQGEYNRTLSTRGIVKRRLWSKRFRTLAGLQIVLPDKEEVFAKIEHTGTLFNTMQDERTLKNADTVGLALHSGVELSGKQTVLREEDGSKVLARVSLQRGIREREAANAKDIIITAAKAYNLAKAFSGKGKKDMAIVDLNWENVRPPHVIDMYLTTNATNRKILAKLLGRDVTLNMEKYGQDFVQAVLELHPKGPRYAKRLEKLKRIAEKDTDAINHEDINTVVKAYRTTLNHLPKRQEFWDRLAEMYMQELKEIKKSSTSTQLTKFLPKETQSKTWRDI
jgi:hypothetical protein